MTKRDINKPNKFDNKLIKEHLNQDISFTSGDHKLRSIDDITLNNKSDSDALLSSSFILGLNDEGLENTQQLNVDFSDFTNHTFFNSAIVNTNVAFDKVLNNYPFDGSRANIITFLENLTGFERYIFDNFPRNIGYLNFSGSFSSSITIKDYANSKKLNLQELGSGYNVLDPRDNKSFTIETQIYVPEIETFDHQVIFQKLSGSDRGISLMLSKSTDQTSGTIMFAVTSGTQELFTSATLEKGKFNHIAAMLDRENENHQVKFYVNSELFSTSSGVNIGQIDFTTSDITLCTGTTHTFSGSIDYEPRLTFSGALDELRVWHATRSIDNLTRFSTRNVFANNDLKLYLRFNEPQQTDKPNIVIDHSGYGLHGTLQLDSNYRMDTLGPDGLAVSASLRNTSSLTSPLVNENSLFSPVLFNTHQDVKAFNTNILTTASNYDDQNPNLITRLFPQHYFEEGAIFDKQEETSNLFLNTLDTLDKKLGTAQILASFLYVIAKGLDELKIFVDQFQNILTVNLDDFDNAPNALIDKIGEFYGLTFSTFFEDATFRQIFFNENITVSDDYINMTLLEIRDVLWKRIFSSLPDILKSKGTMHAIKSFIRAVGINPDHNFRIREYGGATISEIKDIRLPKSEVSTLLDMSASSGNSRGNIVSPFLTASRMNINNYLEAHHINTGSFNSKDVLRGSTHGGLLTSQSFTIEQIIKIAPTAQQTQSISRVAITGSDISLTDFAMNLVAFSSSIATTSSSLKLFIKPLTAAEADQSDRAILMLTGVNVFSNQKWNVAYGKENISDVSSSYFLYAAQNKNTDVDMIYSASVNMRNTGSTGFNVFSMLDADINASGSFLIFGSASAGNDEASTMRLLISGTNLSSDYEGSNFANFTGKIGHIRFWTKALTKKEFKEHTLNFKSIGVNTPRNMSFNTASTERLILDASTDQANLRTNADGEINIFDFTQNDFHLTGTGFSANDAVIKNEEFKYSILSPFFDENQNVDKVQIRSFTQKENILFHNVDAAPISEVTINEFTTYDPRFSIDFSIIEALNEDIIKIMSSLDSFNNDIGDVNNLFDFEYKNLHELRRLYFKRLTDNVNMKSFFDFFIWFDQNMSNFIKKLIPARTNFKGINFVIESHILERPKFNYNYYNIYLDEKVRNHSGADEIIQRLE
ncbi:hypothetical protein CMI47_03950 [Candidatus Pacearchaeota archaeon]|nr:hypothetical protein [Candidatus Pacearchaeota archaeon]|tara:strand:+ start:4328 stop:7804 length:3477 start_codon:yes stop_codon:yes gene_type:complete